ncbi:integrin alpha-9-like [Bacillus rossius redtenbacheri]|uniref:integrin alpha-9-like n=1 Tax=Bacillus rossius redtenbacheri TaxID=93214 RepID=UPI002FDEF0E6
MATLQLQLLLLLAARATCFNVDSRRPLVWPARRPAGLYGYSVALVHRAGEHRLLVGEPRGNSTYSRRWKEPGAVHQCRIRDFACEELFLEVLGNGVEDRTGGYAYHSNNDHAWLGATISVLQIPDSPVVVCAPRWKNAVFPGHYLMQGMCHVLPAEPAPASHATKIFPLNDHRRLSYPAPLKRGRKQPEVPFYAYGEAGLSAHLTEDGSELLIGAPGVFDWAGTIIVYRNITNDLENFRIPNPINTPSKQGPHHYFGYAVTSGKFFSRSETLYVSSAPRAGQLRGKVFVFGLAAREAGPLAVRAEAAGRQLGEYFGAALCAADVDGDGLDDLLVGAPRRSLQRDEGRVYVFSGRTQGRLIEMTDENEIVGDRTPGANFGSSIASMGDINKDGYPDIAVGAPYGGEDGRGAIFIYHGHRNGLRDKYSQRILGSDISKSIRGFGISISNGLDIDGNGYNDVAVGAHLSGHAAVLRTRPVVAVRARLTSDAASIAADSSSFQVASCLSYTGQHAPPAIDVRSSLEVDPQLSRAFLPAEPYNSNKHIEDVVVFSTNTSCKNFTVSIKEGQKDLSKPIEVKLDYTLHDDVTINSRKKRGAAEDFCKDCPMLDPSQPTSVILRVPYANECGQDGLCSTNLRLQAELVSTAKPLVLGNQSTVSVKVRVESLLDPAFQARAILEAPRSVSLVRMPSSCRKVSTATQLRVECDVGDPLTSSAGPRNFAVDLGVTDVLGNTSELVFNITAVSAGLEQRPEDNSKLLTLAVRAFSDIRTSGTSEQDTFYFRKTNEKDNEVMFIHYYQVRNYGPSNVDSLQLKFRVPIEVVTAEETIVFNKLYLPNASLSGQQMSCSASRLQLFEENTALDRWLESAHASAPAAETLFLDCSQQRVRCVTVTCHLLAPLSPSKTAVAVYLHMRTSLQRLAPILGRREVIILSTLGGVWNQSESSLPHMESFAMKTVETVFRLKTTRGNLETWVLAIATGTGMLLFLLLVMALLKLEFFCRSREEEFDDFKNNFESDGNAEDDTSYEDKGLYASSHLSSLFFKKA